MSISNSEPQAIPQRIVHVSFGLDVGGLERLLLEIAEATDPQRQQLFFVSLGSIGEVGMQLRRLGWPVVCLHRPQGVRLSLVLSLARIFHGVGASVVHTHDARALIYGAPAARLMRIRRIVHTQHGQNLDMTPRRLLLLRLAARMTNDYVCVSHDARRIALSHGISADRIRVIHNGINVEGFIEKSDVCNDDNEQDSLVAVARLSPEKGISMLLRAVALLRDSIPELQLEIAGSGPCHAELLHEASELGIEGQVTFLGQVTHPGEVLGRGRIFVLPSLSEGISLTLLESMAMGIPVIATNVGGNSEVIKDGYTGLLVPDSDPQTLADAIRKLWYDSDLRFQLALAAKQNVAEMFHVQRMIHQYEQLYRGVGLTHEYRNVDDASFLEHQVAAGENL